MSGSSSWRLALRSRVRTGKHAPARFSHYARAHLQDLEQLTRSGFIQPDHGAEFTAVPGGFLLDATFDREAGIIVHARKLARIVSDAEGDDPVVETAWYSYNVSLRGVGNIVRYDSPFFPDLQGHHATHHVHRYDVLAGDVEGGYRRPMLRTRCPTWGR